MTSKTYIPAFRSRGALGKLSPRIPPKLRDWGDYLTAPLPPPPPSVDWGTRVNVWPMDGNDTIGDCAIAGLAHARQAWAAEVGMVEPQPSLQEITQTYFSLTGGQDTGLVLSNVLQHYRTQGLFGGKCKAYAPVHPQHTDAVKQCVAAYGCAYMGIQLRQSSEQQFAQGLPWTVVPNSPIIGGHCLVPSTRTLTAGLEWVALGDVKEGDRLVGFDEHSPGPHKRRRFKTATVEATRRLQLPCYELEWDDGTVVTASYDHLWLVGNNGIGGGLRWISTEQLRPLGPSGKYGTQMKRMFAPWERDASWGAGYLAGAFDGEGWIDGDHRNIHKIGYCQRANPMLERTRQELTGRGYAFWEGLHNSRAQYGTDPIVNLIIHRRDQVVPFLGSVRPPRLLSKFSADRLGAMHGATVRLVRKSFVGEREVVAVQTDQRTFLAEGLPSHNCIVAIGYDENWIDIVTWGSVVRMDWRLWALCGDECWAIIPSEFVQAGAGPTLDLHSLEADLDSLEDL